MVRILPFWTSLFIVVVLGSTPAESQSVKTSTRIVGGAAVRNKDKFPYFAHLRVKWNDDDGIRHIITCGGSLITSTAVLTAAHCLTNPRITSIAVFLGVSNMKDPNLSESQMIMAKSWKAHPSYDDSALYDIGVIRLARAVLSSAYEPISLKFASGFPTRGKETIVVGVGYTTGVGPLSDTVRQVQLRVRRGAVCDGVYGDFDERRQICAGGSGKVPCQGDSGGPMIVMTGSGLPVLAGIVSYGDGGCNQLPAVFTRVSAFQGWIEVTACDGSGNLPSWCPGYKKSSSIGCFAGSNIVEVYNRGPVRMQELKLGDRVKVATGKYEPIYSFGHVAPSAVATFLHIRTSMSTLRLTEDHMVFTTSERAVSASNLRVGDCLLGGSGLKDLIESIDIVQDEGLFAPFTPSGKLLVNNILVSSYVAVVDQRDLGMGWTSLDLHWLSHGALFPRRLLCCHLVSCPTETYNSEGIPHWVEFLDHAFWWLLNYNTVVRATLLITMAVVATMVTVVETWFWLPTALIVLCILSILSLANKFHKKPQPI